MKSLLKWQRLFLSFWWVSYLCTTFIKAQRYNVQDASFVDQRRAQMTRAADDCVAQLGTSLGESFLECTLEKLEHVWPLPPYTMHPLTILEDDEHQHGLLLLDLLRNYTCGRTQDGGSPPIATETWIYDEKANAEQTKQQTCASTYPDEDSLVPKTGYLPDGDHLTERRMTVENAKQYCDRWPQCQGFTFELKNEQEEGKHSIFFKSKADKVSYHKAWRTYVRRTSQTMPKRCRQDPTDNSNTENRHYSPPQEFKVEVIRREPLVVKIPNFASSQECQRLQKAGGSDQQMGRAHETGQGPTSYRRSYSADINVNYHDQSAPLTKFAERMFAFVRNVTHYQVYGPGQEPINAVLYKNAGDEYRPHCDGLCDGQLYPYGQRVATSILYCQVPPGEHGGQTSFTRSGLMVAPQVSDLLLFAYKYPNGTMDNGLTEHSGCKINGGRKWIATQWYREGVDFDQPWSLMYD